MVMVMIIIIISPLAQNLRHDNIEVSEIIKQEHV